MEDLVVIGHWSVLAGRWAESLGDTAGIATATAALGRAADALTARPIPAGTAGSPATLVAELRWQEASLGLSWARRGGPATAITSAERAGRLLIGSAPIGSRLWVGGCDILAATLSVRHSRE